MSKISDLNLPITRISNTLVNDTSNGILVNANQIAYTEASTFEKAANEELVTQKSFNDTVKSSIAKVGEEIEAINKVLSLEGTDVNGVIDTFNEVKNFLKDYSDATTLSEVLQPIATTASQAAEASLKKVFTIDNSSTTQEYNQVLNSIITDSNSIYYIVYPDLSKELDSSLYSADDNYGLNSVSTNKLVNSDYFGKFSNLLQGVKIGYDGVNYGYVGVDTLKPLSTSNTKVVIPFENDSANKGCFFQNVTSFWTDEGDRTTGASIVNVGNLNQFVAASVFGTNLDGTLTTKRAVFLPTTPIYVFNSKDNNVPFDNVNGSNLISRAGKKTEGTLGGYEVNFSCISPVVTASTQTLAVTIPAASSLDSEGNCYKYIYFVTCPNLKITRMIQPAVNMTFDFVESTSIPNDIPTLRIGAATNEFVIYKSTQDINLNTTKTLNITVAPRVNSETLNKVRGN